MADLTVTAAQVSAVFPDKCEIYSFIAGATITAGQPVYMIAATGKVGVADANGSAPAPQFKGIALNGGVSGTVINVLKRGAVYGFDLSGINYGVRAYLSDTAGSLADAAGTTSVAVGQVIPLLDAASAGTKVLYIDASWSASY